MKYLMILLVAVFLTACGEGSCCQCTGEDCNISETE